MLASFVGWTPDGSTILFSNGPRIHAVTADGSRFWRVAETFAVGPGARPAEYVNGVYVAYSSVGTFAPFTIAPDGEHIVYATCANPRPEALVALAAGARLDRFDYVSELVRARIDGTEHQRLTENNRFDNHPSWSPDGTRIAYLSDHRRNSHPNGASDRHIYTMAPDGSEQAMVSGGAVDLQLPPRWSPDGTRLAFFRTDADYETWLHTIGVDGRTPRRLAVAHAGPAWSPDGQQLAFLRRDGDDEALYTITADGSDAQRVTTIPRAHPLAYFGVTLEWSPDGKSILYSCGLAICVIDLASSQVIRAPITLFDYPGPARLAAWSPDGSRIAIIHIWGSGAEISSPNQSIAIYTMAPDGSDLRILVVRVDGSGLRPIGPGRRESPPNVAACAAGRVVHQPAANPGLVHDCETLLRLRGSFNASPLLRWNLERSIDEWEGVHVSGSPPRVTELSLSGRKLWGIIPPEVAELTGLQVLDLQYSRLAGSIPSELGQLAQLSMLKLAGNYLGGEIPAALGSLSSLTELRLGRNFLHGRIPPELGELQNLITLDFEKNLLTGEVPAEIGQLASLRTLILQENRLSGPIPESFGRLARLEVLALSHNQLTGTIPAGIGRLPNLRKLFVAGNQLTVTIPADLGEMASLESLYLGNGFYPNPAIWKYNYVYSDLNHGTNVVTGCVPPAWMKIEYNDLASLELLECEPA